MRSCGKNIWTVAGIPLNGYGIMVGVEMVKKSQELESFKESECKLELQYNVLISV